ncbi:MAG TPA: molybdopterin-dependent oxidoreductase, partial [Burkholderiales bacterium]
MTRSVASLLGKTIDRRTFLKRSGIAVGAGAIATQLPFSIVEPAKSAETVPANSETRHTVCTHCSVGCAVDAVVQNGVWIRQEAAFDSPINLGSHCSKGASVREHGMTHDSRRLKYPMKLVNGKYSRVSWDEALDGITTKIMQIRKVSGPDSAYFVGS